MVSSEFGRQLDGYGLITAQILYHMPDHPRLLQSFLWQRYDLAPRFPELMKFLDYWRAELEGPLHSVQVAYRREIGPSRWESVSKELKIH